MARLISESSATTVPTNFNPRLLGARGSLLGGISSRRGEVLCAALKAGGALDMLAGSRPDTGTAVTPGVPALAAEAPERKRIRAKRTVV
jgi:hypothetical protein